MAEEESLENVSSSNTSAESDIGESFTEVNAPVPAPKEEKPITIEESCHVMLDKIADYLNGELAGTSSDYKLLEKLNKLSVDKYSEMSKTTTGLIANMENINERYKSLAPYLAQIDMLEESVLKLEQTAYKLDSYSKELETKFRNMEKR